MKRQHQILLAILAVQLILSIVVFWPRSAATGQSGPVFADLEAGDITALTITDAEGKSIALSKASGSWTLPEADDYPAQAEKIAPVLADIAGLVTGRLVTRTDASHRQLQVAPDSYQRRIEFETSDGTDHVFYLGSSPSYGATHFRRADQNETYLTDGITVWEASTAATTWLDTAYQSVERDTITQIALVNGNGTFIFDKDDQDNWAMGGLLEGEVLDDVKVSSLLGQVASVSLVRPLGKEEKPAYGLDHPSAVVVLESLGKSITLRVGTQDPRDGAYVVSSSESPFFVRITEYMGNQLVEKTLSDFLQAPPTPAPVP